MKLEITRPHPHHRRHPLDYNVPWMMMTMIRRRWGQQTTRKSSHQELFNMWRCCFPSSLLSGCWRILRKTTFFIHHHRRSSSFLVGRSLSNSVVGSSVAIVIHSFLCCCSSTPDEARLSSGLRLRLWFVVGRRTRVYEIIINSISIHGGCGWVVDGKEYILWLNTTYKAAASSSSSATHHHHPWN